MKFNYKKIFITGANGWLGKQIVKTLIKGDKDVFENFDNNSCKLKSLVYTKDDNIKFLKKFNIRNQIIKGDIRLKSDCNRFLSDSKGGLIIHVAGVIHPKKVKDFYEINLQGTKNIIESGIENGIKKFVVMSSNSPIGCNKTKSSPFNENSPYNPYMNYGESKMKMEKYLFEKISQGFNITIIRSPWFYGDNMPKRQYSFYKMIKKGIVPVIGNGKNLRSKANVKNITQGVLLCANKKISSGKLYWIADENPYSYNEIINTVRKILNEDLGFKVKKSFIKIPFLFGQLFELIDYIIQSTGHYNQKVHVLSELNKNIYCSINKAKKELGYEPKINLYHGLKKELAKNYNNLL